MAKLLRVTLGELRRFSPRRGLQVVGTLPTSQCQLFMTIGNICISPIVSVAVSCPELDPWTHGLFTCLYYYYNRRAVRKNLSSNLDVFLAVRSQFDCDHGVDFYAHTCCQSATFGPLFAFYWPLFLIIYNVAFRPRRVVYAAVFALDVATALRQINS